MEWLNKLIDSLFKFVPRIWLVNPNEAGVRITLGKHVKDTPPGWYFYWPLIQECTTVVVVSQVVTLKPQSIMTVDAKSIVMTGAIQYCITSARKAILNVEDYDESLRGLALGIIVKFTKNRKLEECRDLNSLENEILKGTRAIVGDWGLKIQKVFITHIAPARNVMLLTDSSIFRKE